MLHPNSTILNCPKTPTPPVSQASTQSAAPSSCCVPGPGDRDDGGTVTSRQPGKTVATVLEEGPTATGSAWDSRRVLEDGVPPGCSSDLKQREKV